MYTLSLVLLIILLEVFAEEDGGHNRVIRSGRTSVTSGNPQLRALIPKNYNILELPPTNNGTPVHIDFNVLVMGIWNVDESQELLSVDLKLQIYWQDKRLSHLWESERKSGYTILKPQLLDFIWHPDIYVEKVKSINHIGLLTKPSSLRIYPNSVLRYSARLTVTVSCQMDFHYYPADTQYCNIDLQNYSFQINKILLGWKENMASLLDTVRLSNFYIELDSVDDYTVTSLSGDTYSGIRFTVILRRKLSYHLLQTYLPSTIFILVSWLSFIMSYESNSQRLGFSLTCLFTLTSMFSAVRQSTPNVSYVKALDVWMVVCVFFVFLTLLQHAVIDRIKRSKSLAKYYSEKLKLKNNKKAEAENKHNDNIAMVEETSFSRNAAFRNSNGIESKRNLENTTGEEDPPPKTEFQILVKKADRYLSLFIPFLFVNFNIAYWSWLITIKYFSE